MNEKCVKEPLLRVAEVATILGTRVETVRSYIRRGTITAVVLPGGDYRVPREELDKLLSSTTSAQKEVKHGDATL
jgi:excisionase family DNA binding protein